jgi:hypothetical protein
MGRQEADGLKIELKILKGSFPGYSMLQQGSKIKDLG